MNRKKTKKYKFFQKFQLSTFEKIYMDLRLFELREQCFNNNILLKLTQFEKTGSTTKFFIPLENVQMKFQFRN